MIRFVNTLPDDVPTPPADRTTLFVSDAGEPSFKDSAGVVRGFSDNPATRGYIDGLKLEWVSGTQVRVTSGAAYVPGPKRIAELAAAVTLTPSLAANTWYHVYLTVVSGVVSAEASTAAPAAPYTGTARAKTGDTSRRYAGSFRTDASSVIFNFIHINNVIVYRVDSAGAAHRVLASGAATTATSVACIAVVPMTSQLVTATVTNQGTPGVRILESLGTYGATGRIYGIAAGSSVSVPIPLNASQEFLYYNTGAGGNAVAEVTGYEYQR